MDHADKRRRPRERHDYSRFIAGLKAAEVDLDRKVLADLAVPDPEQFGKLAEQARAALPQ